MLSEPNQNYMLEKNKKHCVNIFCILLLLCVAVACKTGSKFEPQNAEEAFNEGFRLFERKKFNDAMSYFDMIKLQYPASGVADKAQYYIAEIHFARKEFVLASFNYNRVRTVFPGSEFAKSSLFKAGYSQYMLAPDFHKDQEHTRRAIRTLQEFQYFYSDKTDSLYTKADKIILELRNTLGRKEYEIARLYQRLESPRAALIYYEFVIKDFDDTQFLEPAWFGKIEMLYRLRRVEDAENAVSAYNKLFPDGKYKQQMEELATRGTGTARRN